MGGTGRWAWVIEGGVGVGVGVGWKGSQGVGGWQSPDREDAVPGPICVSVSVSPASQGADSLTGVTLRWWGADDK